MPDVQPVGPPGTWSLVFEDLFDGTSLDTSKWTIPVGANNSNTTMTAAGVSVSGGYCHVTMVSSGSAGCINSQPSLQQWASDPTNGTTVNVGDCVEASVFIPGPTNSTSYNWPAFWVSGANWPANGEEDIVEGYDGSLSALNYHSNSGPNNGPHPAGNWTNSFHTYTLVRGASSIDCYWDGTKVRSITPDDNGGPQSIIFLLGTGNTLATGAASDMKIDYVRKWVPSTGGGGGGGSAGSTPSLAFSDFKNSAVGGTLTSASFTPQAGDVIVVKAGTETSEPAPGGPAYIITNNPTGGGLTYTKRISDDQTANWGSAYLWTAPAVSGGSAMSVSLVGPTGSSTYWAMEVEVWRGGQLAASPVIFDVQQNNVAPSTPVTTTQDNSVLSWGIVDWNGASGTAVYRSGAIAEGSDIRGGAVYNQYMAYQDCTTAGVQTVGMTSPGGQRPIIYGVEIQALTIANIGGVLGIL